MFGILTHDFQNTHMILQILTYDLIYVVNLQTNPQIMKFE